MSRQSKALGVASGRLPVGDSARRVGGHLANLARPHYVFRPSQILHRVAGNLEPGVHERRFPLLWGPEITLRPASQEDPVGLGLLRRGIFDLLVCETLLRLADPGETVLDVGANVGHMTSLLAHAVGERGRVISFEPHPDVFALLARNVAEWTALPATAPIELLQLGLSDADGEATLATDVFEINQGSASLEPPAQRRGTLNEHRVRIRRLDDILADQSEVGIMKIDIEGHELHALRGADATLSSGRIRDIVFEEHEPPPTPVTQLLEHYGYTVVQLGERLRGPVLAPLGAAGVAGKDDPSLLATRAPDRAVERLGARGWAIYGVGPAGRVERRRRPAVKG